MSLIPCELMCSYPLVLVFFDENTYKQTLRILGVALTLELPVISNVIEKSGVLSVDAGQLSGMYIMCLL